MRSGDTKEHGRMERKSRLVVILVISMAISWSCWM